MYHHDTVERGFLEGFDGSAGWSFKNVSNDVLVEKALPGLILAVYYRHHQIDDKKLRVAKVHCRFFTGIEVRGGSADRCKSHEVSHCQGYGERENKLPNLETEKY